MKYFIIGGNPFTMYTGTTAITGLYVVGKTDTLEEAKKMFQEKWDECGGVLLIIDAATGTAQ